MFQALEEALAPRLRLAGDTGSLTKFGDFLSSKTMEKGTDIILLYRPEGVLEMAILPPGSSEYTQASQHLYWNVLLLSRLMTSSLTAT